MYKVGAAGENVKLPSITSPPKLGLPEKCTELRLPEKCTKLPYITSPPIFGLPEKMYKVAGPASLLDFLVSGIHFLDIPDSGVPFLSTFGYRVLPSPIQSRALGFRDVGYSILGYPDLGVPFLSKFRLSFSPFLPNSISPSTIRIRSEECAFTLQ